MPMCPAIIKGGLDTCCSGDNSTQGHLAEGSGRPVSSRDLQGWDLGITCQNGSAVQGGPSPLSEGLPS